MHSVHSSGYEDRIHKVRCCNLEVTCSQIVGIFNIRQYIMTNLNKVEEYKVKNCRYLQEDEKLTNKNI